MYQAPIKSRLPETIRRQMPPELAYLGEDQNYYYFAGPGDNSNLGGFFKSLGKMFSRAVKITPRSFTFKNITRGFVNSTLGIASGGLIYALPKNVRQTIGKVAEIAYPTIAAGVAAVVLGPSVMGVLGPKLQSAASILGKNASSIGGNLMSYLQKLSPAQQAQVAQTLTPQQIAQMETSAQLPAELTPMFRQAMAASLPPERPYGAGALYSPSEREAREPVQAGMLGELNLSTVALFGIPILFFAMQSAGKRR